MPEIGERPPQKPVTAMGILERQSPQAAEEVTRNTKTFSEGIARAFLEMNPSQRQAFGESLAAFVDNIYIRAGAENLKDISRIQTTLDGANALLSPEPDNSGAAKRMIDALQKRY